MTRVLTVFSFVLMLTVIGCTEKNEQATVEWVKNAKKPIVCKKVGSYETGSSEWTLVDADGNIHVTGAVNMRLPDTIKVIQ